MFFKIFSSRANVVPSYKGRNFIFFCNIFHMLQTGGALGLPWGPITIAQEAPLHSRSWAGAGSVLLGAVSSVSSLRAECPEQGPVWSQQVLPPRGSKWVAPTSP